MKATMSSSSNSITSLSLDEVIDRLVVMRRQEESCYAYRHYLSSSSLPKANSNNNNNNGSSKRINVTWREKIVKWTYNVVDQ
jgi:hypothetical protein